MSEAVHRSDPLALLRYVDVLLVLATAPVVVLAELPLLGYGVAVAAWIAQRMAAQYVERRARELANLRHAVGLNLAVMFARTWFVAITIVVLVLADRREDGLMAAVTLLVAFTVYFVMTLILGGSAKETSK